MSKEEFEAIEIVNDYLLHQAVITAQKFYQKEISFEEFAFWKNTYCNYSEYCIEVRHKYYNTKRK